ncbi:uncharacterized protein LOC131842851 [Achroia grisella]|uniref:uncharacterized protein LOC131842851 n=1 Tax=Achroia grisella TaxID=688607 RepID=UPI0027D2A71D|nr:uncharacterized protein LOC131842851 [Achroia grisella]
MKEGAGAACAGPARVSVYGRPREVSVWWSGAGGRAAAALLLAAAAHGLRYSGLRLRRAHASSCDFIRQLPHNCKDHNDEYDDIALVPSLPQCHEIDVCGDEAGASRLSAVGAGAAPATLRLYSYLTRRARKLPICTDALHWTFFENINAVELCSFETTGNHTSQKRAIVFTPEELVAGAQQLIETASHLTIKSLRSDAESRQSLLKLLRESDTSFLFLDYDIWTGMNGIHIIEPPLIPLFDPVCTLRLANAKVLNQVAPQLYETVLHFAPTVSELRTVLEIEANYTDFNITEAACYWAIQNNIRFESWLEKARTFKPNYWITIFLCKDDEDIQQYIEVAKRVVNATSGKFNKIEIKLEFVEDVDCTCEYDLKERLSKYREQYIWTEMVGALATGAGAKGATYLSAEIDTALVLYDTPNLEVSPGDSTRIIGGHLMDLIIAIERLLLACNLKRLAILSDDTRLASDYVDTLLENNVLAVRNVTLKTNISFSEIRDLLQTMQKYNARIFFVNTDAKIATLILCAAMSLDMTQETGYIWLLREWRATNYTCVDLSNQYKAINHITISFWWRGGTNFFNNSNEEMRQALNELWGDGNVWPQLATPLADGLILLLNSFYTFIEGCDRNVQDLHGDGTTNLLWTSLKNGVYGITQELHSQKYAYVNPIIFVDEWQGALRRPIVEWQITDGQENGHMTCRLGSKYMISDGTKHCLTTSSNREKFMPHCHDTAWTTAIITIIFGMLALYSARRLRVKLLKESIPHAIGARENIFALAEHLVDRTALEFRQDLGFGRFGRVRFAILRVPNRPTVVVAAKSLHENSAPAEETEFLREACTLASLRHENVVRLIGVCATNGPPLVLMEHAFFGDLLGYLRERRHLIEHVHEEIPKEATHVSPLALTQLAREASSALAYLSQRRLVHRDVRASNCLIDARRSLKLADFGMARETTCSDGIAEYTCRRRGFFPVLWMAPESLDRGVFSAATDVWALGVLMLELVTLGERPYGAWSPLRVLRYVIAGGRPSLPCDASLKTRGVLLSCWRRVPGQRPTAADIAAYLEVNPLTLSPALESMPPSPEYTATNRFHFKHRE